jgi:hypothetical protein
VRHEARHARGFEWIGDWGRDDDEYGEESPDALRRLQQIRKSIAAVRADLTEGRRLDGFRTEGQQSHCTSQATEFVLIQVCEADGAALPLCEKGAFRECLARHVAMARRIGIAPILVAPLRMSVYTPASQRRRELSYCVAAMQEVAAEMEAPLVDLHTGSGALFRLVARELSRQLESHPNRFIYHHEPGIKRALSWWHVRDTRGWNDHTRMGEPRIRGATFVNRE